MMRSATAFLPPSMMTFMNLDSSTLPNLGSGRISRLGTSRRRGIFHLLLQLAFLRKPRAPFRHPLTRPLRNIRNSGHYAASPRHAENSTCYLWKTEDLLGLGLLCAVLG